MKNRQLKFLFLLLVLSLMSCKYSKDAVQSDILENLQNIPGANVEEIEPKVEGYQRAFKITLEQPLDHQQPRGKKFQQTLFLLHRAINKPLVMHTSGYSIWRSLYHDEVASLIEGNLLLIPHRYYPGAKPEKPLDYTYLTIEQSAADLHRINQFFRKIYSGKIVSTGRSKGGMTALFYRRYYPKDVDATIALVAPIMYTKNDPRFRDFFLKDPAKQQKIRELKEFQR
ncbi:MAG: peptidase, partial [Spirochaetes bacterium]|nr:peptidase [Spirochaetota bacterium]